MKIFVPHKINDPEKIIFLEALDIFLAMVVGSLFGILFAAYVGIFVGILSAFFISKYKNQNQEFYFFSLAYYYLPEQYLPVKTLPASHHTIICGG